MNNDEYGAWINTSGEYIPVYNSHIQTAHKNGIPLELYNACAIGWVRVVCGKHAALHGTRDAVRTIWPRIAKRLIKNAVSVSIDFSGPYEGECFNMPTDRAKMVRWIMKS